MPPLDEMSTQKQRAQRLRLWLGAMLVIGLVLGSADSKALAFINVYDTVETAVEQLFQGPAEIGSAELSNLNRISVRDIVVKDPLDDTTILLEVDELILRYSIIGLVVHMSNVEKAIQEIALHNPSLYVKVEEGGWNLSRLFKKQSGGGDGQTSLLIRVEKGHVNLMGTNLGVGTIGIGLEGALQVEGSALKLEQTNISVFGSEFKAHGSLCDGDVDLTLKGSKIDLGEVTAGFPQTKETLVQGKATMEIRAGGTLKQPLLDGMISMGQGKIEFPSHANLAYSIDGLEAFFRYTDQMLEMTKLEIAQKEARFQARGIIDVKGNMHLDIIAQGFDLARNLKFIESYGIAGKANLAGALSGTVLQPDFRGELYVAGGTLRGQPYDELRGHVAVDLKDVKVTGCNIRKGRSIYAVAGSLGFGSALDMDITVQSSGGRAEDVLAFLGIPGDLSGRVDGELEIRGGKNALITKGSVRMSQGRFQEQMFDSAGAEFMIDAGRVTISRGNIGLADGTLDFFGATGSDGILRLDVQAQNIRTEQFLLLQDLADSFEGRLDLKGTAALKGTLAQPWLRLQVATHESDRILGDSTSKEVEVLLSGRKVMIGGKDAGPTGSRLY
ncbi:MAG: hypothetical protein GX316_10015 [Firmicutes bacterium]|nr:hypothetical protein [Bacillota bacterium]